MVLQINDSCQSLFRAIEPRFSISASDSDKATAQKPCGYIPLSFGVKMNCLSRSLIGKFKLRPFGGIADRNHLA